jgi:hypothetical protein
LNLECPIHTTLRVTPAMAAGVTDRPWEVSDIRVSVEANDASQGKAHPTESAPSEGTCYEGGWRNRIAHHRAIFDKKPTRKHQDD